MMCRRSITNIVVYGSKPMKLPRRTPNMNDISTSHRERVRVRKASREVDELPKDIVFIVARFRFLYIGNSVAI